MTNLVPARLTEVAIVERPSGPQAPPPMPAPDELALNHLEPVPGERQYVTNPHMWEVIAAGVLLLGAATGTTYSAYRDFQHVDLAFAAMLAAVALVVVCTRRFNAWDNDYSPADQA